MKAKRVRKKDANTKTTQRCVIKDEIEVLGINLSAALQAVIDPLDNQLRYMGSKRPFKPNLPTVPKPSKLLL